MGNIKIGGKYVMFRAVESIFYNENLQKVELRTVSGDVLHTKIIDVQQAENIIENTLKLIHEYLPSSI